MQNTCNTCFHFSLWYADINFGNCLSDHVNSHPNYYTDSDDATLVDGLETTGVLKVGKNFGCIHHKVK